MRDNIVGAIICIVGFTIIVGYNIRVGNLPYIRSVLLECYNTIHVLLTGTHSNHNSTTPNTTDITNTYIDTRDHDSIRADALEQYNAFIGMYDSATDNTKGRIHSKPTSNSTINHDNTNTTPIHNDSTPAYNSDTHIPTKQQRVIDAIRECPECTVRQLVEMTGTSNGTVQRAQNKLRSSSDRRVTTTPLITSAESIATQRWESGV